VFFNQRKSNSCKTLEKQKLYKWSWESIFRHDQSIKKIEKEVIEQREHHAKHILTCIISLSAFQLYVLFVDAVPGSQTLTLIKP